MPRLILASASPRRARLLTEARIAFEARPMDVDESPPPNAPPAEAAVAIARRKAEAVREPGAWVLAADTMVVHEGRLLGKPADVEDARRILRALAGAMHEVVTGVALRAPDGALRSGAQTTRVTFRALRDDEIDAYVATGEPMDKAGAYGIQGKAQAFVARVDGPVDNVVGLPMTLVRRLLAESGWPG